MLATMPEKKKKKPKPKRAASKAVQFYTTPELADALAKYIDDQPPDRRPKMRGVIEVALMNYLHEKGYWPARGDAPATS